MKSLCFVSATFPPNICGIGDYTAMLAGQMAPRCRVKVLTARGRPSLQLSGVEVQQAFDLRQLRAGRQIIEAIEADPPDWLFLQYDPYSFGMRYAFDPVIPLTIMRLRRRCPETRVAVMVHELFARALSWKKAIMTTWQRAQILALGKASDVIFFSIDPWMRRIGPWFPGRRVEHLPVGSNVPRQPITRDEARSRLGLQDGVVILGLFGRGGPSRDLTCVENAVSALERAGYHAALLYLGHESAILRRALPNVRFIDDNPHPIDEISRRFSAMDIQLLPIADEGVSTRRTTLMAGLEHGVASVATLGSATDDLLLREDGKSLVLAPVGDPVGFGTAVVELAADTIRRQAVGAAGQVLFRREFAWDRITDRLADALSLSGYGAHAEES